MMNTIINRLQLKDFRLILAIHKTGQLAMAADQLAMSQPAASRMLASTEKMIGTHLFERHPKGMVATPIGEILARNAINLLQGLEAAENEVSSFGAGLGGTAR
ncbi:MAG: LysR family transcriptional regulator, partial [Nitratireductor sp.]